MIYCIYRMQNLLIHQVLLNRIYSQVKAFAANHFAIQGLKLCILDCMAHLSVEQWGTQIVSSQ